MWILSRYILREHIGPFFFALSIITAMLVLNFVLQAMRYIIGKGIRLGVIMEFIVYNLAWIMVLVVPMAILVSTIMAFGRLSSDNEITAMKAGGIGFYRLIFPVLFAAGAVMIGVFYFNDQILPVANHKARILKKSIQTKRPTLSLQPGVFLDGIENYSLLVENKDEFGAAIYGVTIFDRSTQGTVRTITARQGAIEMDEASESMIVSLEDGELHEFQYSRQDQYQRMKFSAYRIVIPVENMTLKKTEENYLNDREKTVVQLMSDVEHRLDEKQRRVNTVHQILNEDPAAASGLDPRSRKILSDQVFRESWLDRISDGFMNFNLSARTDSVARETVIPLDESLRDEIMMRLRDTAGTARNETGSAGLPLELNPRFMNRLPIGEAKRDSVSKSRNANIQQLVSNLSALSNYQRMVDQLMIEVNKKYSIPVACLIFVLLGAPIGVKARKGNLGIAGGISLFFFIAYYFCLVLGEDYGDRQLLNPFFAMWFPNIILGVTGIVLTWQTASERTFGFHRVFPAIGFGIAYPFRLWRKRKKGKNENR